MKVIVNKATSLRPQGIRNIDAPLVAINLPFYISEVKKEKTWVDKEKNAITVFKTDHLKMVLMVLKKGAELKECTIPSLLTIQVLEGVIKFSTPLKCIELNEGEMITLHEGISHTIIAMEEVSFLLTIVGM